MPESIRTPLVEGQASRQAHADLPEGTYEREMGREGFFGPVSHLHHRHPPTGWTSFEGPLRPRAFDTVKLTEFGPSPCFFFTRTRQGRSSCWARNASSRRGTARTAGSKIALGPMSPRSGSL